jgi:Tfp pilus assembly protein PilN
MRDCDFIPASHRQECRLRRAIRRRAALLLGLVAVILIWGAAHQRELSSARAMTLDLTLQQEQLTVHVARKAALEEEWAALASREKLIRQLSNAIQVSVVLSDISRRQPDTVVLTNLELASPSLSRYQQKNEMILEGSESSPKHPEAVRQSILTPAESARLMLRGLAKSPRDVIRFAALLEGSPLMSQVVIQSQEPSLWAGRHAEAFVIYCELLEQEKHRP